jgi:hypothetical protein
VLMGCQLSSWRSGATQMLCRLVDCFAFRLAMTGRRDARPMK